MMPGLSSSNKERGSATLETVIVVPAALMLILLIVFAGRYALARQAVNQAAWDAARTASIARTESEASANAHSTAKSVLDNQGLNCAANVAVDTSQFANPPGVAGVVTVFVSCTVPLADLSVPGIPEYVTLTATATSPLDTYRG
jgi:Flp pilus assembly protein TadG